MVDRDKRSHSGAADRRQLVAVVTHGPLVRELVEPLHLGEVEGTGDRGGRAMEDAAPLDRDPHRIVVKLVARQGDVGPEQCIVAGTTLGPVATHTVRGDVRRVVAPDKPVRAAVLVA